jgi:hypothetical protein
MAYRRRHRGRGRCLRLAGCALAAAAGAGWLITVPATAAPAGSAAAAAISSKGARAHPWIAITSMTPTVARPKGKITVSGIVANPMAAPLAGLSVQLWSSNVAVASRQSMNDYLAGQTGAAEGFPVPGAQLTLPSRVPAHAAQPWSVTLNVTQVGMRTFGVYPLAAQLNGAAGELDVARTFLPFWPGKSAARTVKPLNIGWVWPLIDVPQRGACAALRTNELAGSVAPGGRLAALLAAGQSADGRNAQLTWAIDPALLSDAAVMKAPYRVGARENCTGGQAQQPSHYAAGWLSEVKAVTAQQDFFITPYADVDLAALAHRGMVGELTHAFNDGHAAAQGILGRTQRATPDTVRQMAWPAGGAADYTVLEELAARQHVGAMILDSRLMPPTAQVSYTPTAATTTPDGGGGQMHVLLADHGLSQMLSLRRNQIPGVTPGATAMPADVRGQIREAAAFGKEQMFLAETAMIASEPAGAPRAVVAAPPRRWDPSPSLAAALLQETVDTPWLRPATLASLAATPPPPGSPARRQPPLHHVGSGELSRTLLRQVRYNLVVQVGLLDSIRTSGGHGYLSTAVDAVESSAWRGSKRDQRPAVQLLRHELAFVEAQLRQVKIVGSSRVTLGGKAGDVPVSVRNDLLQRVTVRLKVSVPPEDQVVIGHYRSVITVPKKSQVTVRVPVQAAAAGSKALSLWLTTPEGDALPGKRVSLTVTATHFGTLAIVIISVALVVFVLSAAARAIRRGGPADGGAEAEELDPMPSTHDPATEGGEPGSVGSGSAEEPQPGREDDEHATAPGRADRR